MVYHEIIDQKNSSLTRPRLTSEGFKSQPSMVWLDAEGIPSEAQRMKQSNEVATIPTKSLAERPKGPNPNASPGGAIPIRELMHMQTLCEEGLTDEAIAAKLGLSLAITAEIIADEGWRMPRDESQALQPKEQRACVRWQRAVAAQARFLSLKGMSLAIKKVEEGDAMGFALSARGTKAFVDMALQADGVQADQGKTGTASVNLFFFAGDAQPVRSREPRSVNPNPVSQSDSAALEAKGTILDVQATV